jgi:hypothetical protein
MGLATVGMWICWLCGVALSDSSSRSAIPPLKTPNSMLCATLCVVRSIRASKSPKWCVQPTSERSSPRSLIALVQVPVWKESGCFVHFTSKSDALASLGEQEALRGLTGRNNRMFIVQGTPFVEDMRDWQPSRVVQIEADGKLSLEEIFSELRQFGQLKSLTGSKQEFSARFADIRAAIAARSCIHGKKRANGVTLNLSYQRALRAADLVKTIYSNTRVLAIVLAVSVAVLTVLVIAPIRSYFVTQTLLVGARVPSWQVMQELSKSFIWTVTTDQEAELRRILAEQPSAVTLLTGDKALGKSQVLRKVLHRRLFSVRIDCGQCDSVQDFLLKLESAIGFTPSFGTLNNLRSYLDAFATLGVKRDGLSDSSATQLRQMLSTLSAALYVLSLRYKSNTKKLARPHTEDGGAQPPAPVVAQPADAEATAPAGGKSIVDSTKDIVGGVVDGTKDLVGGAVTGTKDVVETGAKEIVGVVGAVRDIATRSIGALIPSLGSQAAAPAAAAGDAPVSEEHAPPPPPLPVDDGPSHLDGAPPSGFLARMWDWVRNGVARRNAREKAKAVGANTYAVVVLDNFSELIETMSRQSPAEAKKARELVDMVVQFSSTVTTAGVAHVVLVSHNAFTENMVRSYPALRDCLNTVHARDPSPPQIDRYLKQRLGDDVDTKRVIGVLGCRVSDIEALVRRSERMPNLKLETVLTQLVDETTNHILDSAFGPNLYSFDAPSGATWHPKDVWRVILQLAASKERSLHSGFERASIDYHSTLSTIFKGNEAAVQGLVEAQLMSVWHSEAYRDANGVVQRSGSRLSASSPLVQYAFEKMTATPLLRRGLDSMWFMSDLASLHKAIAEVEDELLKLQQAAYGFSGAEVASAYERARELGERLRVLNSKVEAAQRGLKQMNAMKPAYLP